MQHLVGIIMPSFRYPTGQLSKEGFVRFSADLVSHRSQRWG